MQLFVWDDFITVSEERNFKQYSVLLCVSCWVSIGGADCFSLPLGAGAHGVCTGVPGTC